MLTFLCSIVFPFSPLSNQGADEKPPSGDTTCESGEAAAKSPTFLRKDYHD